MVAEVTLMSVYISWFAGVYVNLENFILILLIFFIEM